MFVCVSLFRHIKFLNGKIILTNHQLYKKFTNSTNTVHICCTVIANVSIPRNVVRILEYTDYTNYVEFYILECLGVYFRYSKFNFVPIEL